MNFDWTSMCLIIALLAPWLALLTLGSARARLLALTLAPLPMALLAVLPEGQLSLPTLLLGMQWAIDGVNRPLLLLAGIGWSLAGAYAAQRESFRPQRLSLFWLLTLAGQTTALLSANIATLYAGYVIMTLAAFGLIVHADTAQAWRAGRVYLILALIGEALILGGITLLASQYGNIGFAQLAQLPVASVGIAPALLVAGFAVKLGVIPLHMWLPLAHPVAPVPASAVLSGILVKAGLLGMLRLVPPEALPWPTLMLTLGLAGAVFGALAGLCQPRLKTVLAYSTISQMGLLFAALSTLPAAGVAIALPAVGLFALHHGLNKLALFLAAGGQVGASRWRGLLFAIPALSLIGLPLSSGALAKYAMKTSLDGAGQQAVSAWLGVTSLMTALVLLHAWRLARHQRRPVRDIHPAWPLAVVSGTLLPWWWAASHGMIPLPDLSAWIDGLWPLLMAVALHYAWRRWPRSHRPAWPSVPEGDLLVPLERSLQAIGRALPSRKTLDRFDLSSPSIPQWSPAVLDNIETSLMRLPAAGGLLLLVAAAIAASRLFGQ